METQVECLRLEGRRAVVQPEEVLYKEQESSIFGNEFR